MASWKSMPKSGTYATGSSRLCLFCFHVYKIDIYTEILSELDLSSLLLVILNNLPSF